MPAVQVQHLISKDTVQNHIYIYIYMYIEVLEYVLTVDIFCIPLQLSYASTSRPVWISSFPHEVAKVRSAVGFPPLLIRNFEI